MLNKAILMGRLTRDPELKITPSGVSVCPFTIAVNRPYSRDKEAQADFIDIVAWRQSAEFVNKYFVKGSMIIVDGMIQTRTYEDRNGNKRKAVESRARVGMTHRHRPQSLPWAIQAAVRRTSRP